MGRMRTLDSNGISGFRGRGIGLFSSGRRGLPTDSGSTRRWDNSRPLRAEGVTLGDELRMSLGFPEEICGGGPGT